MLGSGGVINGTSTSVSCFLLCHRSTYWHSVVGTAQDPILIEIEENFRLWPLMPYILREPAGPDADTYHPYSCPGRDVLQRGRVLVASSPGSFSDFVLVTSLREQLLGWIQRTLDPSVSRTPNGSTTRTLLRSCATHATFNLYCAPV